MIQIISSKNIATSISFVLTLALLITNTFAKTTESPVVITEPDTAENLLNISEKSADRSTFVPTELFTDLTIPIQVDVHMQHRFNEMRSQLLDDRAAHIDYWLTAITIILAIFAIGAVLIGYVGFQRFREIEKEAKGYAEAAKHEYSKTKDAREKQKELLSNISAETVKDNPQEAQRVVTDVTKDPDASLIEKAIGHAITLQSQGLKNDAIEQWRAIAHVAQESDSFLAARAWMSIGYLKAVENPEAAVSAYDKAIKLHPNYPDAYTNRGVANRRMGKLDEAMADYDMAIKIKPDYAMAYSNRAIIWIAKNNIKEAKEDLDMAIKEMPHSVEILNNHGYVNYRLGMFDEARSDMDMAIKLKPDYASAYKNRGNLETELERYEAALSDYTVAINLDPKYEQAYFSRGITNTRLGHVDDARKDLETAIELAQAINYSDLEMQAKQALLSLDAGKGDV